MIVMKNSVLNIQIFPKEIKDFPIGVCNILFNDIDLGFTLATERTALSIKNLVTEVKTDESPQVKEILEIGRNINFECTMSLKKETMEKLGIDNKLKSLIKEGKIKIITLNKELEIDLFRVIIIFEINLNFKKDKQNLIKLKVISLKDYKDEDININFK